MTLKTLFSAALLIVFSSAYTTTFAADIISCDSFENCPDGSEPLTSALLNLQARIEALEAEANAPEEPWQPVVFENGWVAYAGGQFYGAPEYYKDKQGTVHLRGLISNGQCGATMFTLPEGYRPPFHVIALGKSSSNEGFTRVDIRSDGVVISVQNCSPGWISLWNISYRTY